MPRGFTEEEKSLIRVRLLEEGKRLFSIHGFKKTTIRDLTRAAGISQGSFYIFFDSKEELFFDLLDLESREMREALCEDVKAVTTGEARGALRRLILKAIDLADSNQLFRQLYSEQGTYVALTRNLPEQKLRAHIAMDLETVGPLIRRWQDERILRNTDPELIVGLLVSLLFLAMHKKELELVGHGTFEFLVDLIVEGVVNEDGNDR